MVSQGCNHSTSEAEAGGLAFQDLPWLSSSFKASLRYMRPCLQNVSAFKFTTLHFCAEPLSVAVVTRPCNLHTTGAETDRFLQLTSQSMLSISFGLGSVRGCVIKTHKQKNKKQKSVQKVERDWGRHSTSTSGLYVYVYPHIYVHMRARTQTHTQQNLFLII